MSQSFVPRRDLPLVLLTTFVTFCAFYAPQPLLPLFSELFIISSTKSALLITVTFSALCIAPLFVGMLLRHINARLILIVSCSLLGLLQLGFAFSETFAQLLTMRSLQSLLYPLIFTAAVTYCSKAGDSDAIESRVSLYIAMTIMGGLAGRLLSGFLTTWFEWPVTFQLLGLSLLLCSALLLMVSSDTVKPREESSMSVVQSLVSNQFFLSGLAVIFIIFFCFSAILNALPFRMVAIEPAIKPAKISMVYLGYIVCIAIAARSSQLAASLGGPLRSMLLANVVFVFGMVLMSASNTTALILTGFLTASGFFLIHATLIGQLVRLRPEHAGVINGCYISTYYFAGALGSWLPLWVYNQHGWIVFLMCLGFFSLLSIVLLWYMNRHSNSD